MPKSRGRKKRPAGPGRVVVGNPAGRPAVAPRAGGRLPSAPGVSGDGQRVDLDAEICPGIRARIAVPGDLARCGELASLVGIDSASAESGQLAELVNAPSLGCAVLAGAEFGVDQFRSELSKLMTGDLVAAAQAVSLVMVAVTETDEIVGLLIAFPPSAVIEQHLDSPHISDRQMVMVGGLTGVSKLRALAVDPAWRGRGVGTGLLARFKDIYTACHYFYLFGQFDVPERRWFGRRDPGLETFYTQQGFTVLGEGKPLDFFVVFGIHSAILPGPGERFFYHRRPPTNE